MKLRTIAHSRTGDKGSIVNVSLIAFDERHYDALVRDVTADAVKRHFAGLTAGDVVRYELPAIGALNFVLHGVVGGGVTRTLALDSHGKSLSSALLEMEIPDEGL
jgi:non-ribosomal peptide synthetase component E (peptide arylation enzyme)